MKLIEKKTEGRHRRWINLAHKVASQSKCWPYKMGCVIVKGGRVLAMSVNKIGPGIQKHHAYDMKGIHCELGAILQLNPAMLRNATVYVAGVTKGNNWCLSRSCSACATMLSEMGIKCVVYHAKDGELFQEEYHNA